MRLKAANNHSRQSFPQTSEFVSTAPHSPIFLSVIFLSSIPLASFFYYLHMLSIRPQVKNTRVEPAKLKPEVGARLIFAPILHHGMHTHQEIPEALVASCASVSDPPCTSRKQGTLPPQNSRVIGRAAGPSRHHRDQVKPRHTHHRDDEST